VKALKILLFRYERSVSLWSDSIKHQLAAYAEWLEMIHNPAFKVVEFDHFKSQSGLPNFVLSVSEWIEKTAAVGLMVKKGRFGGTFAHKDIAFEFGSAISASISKAFARSSLDKTIFLTFANLFVSSPL
jgi:hypothetical protein